MELRYINLEPENIVDYTRSQKIDAWVMALPNGIPLALAFPSFAQCGFLGVCAPFVDELAEMPVTVVDLSADYRFNEQWSYGLPERYRETLRGEIFSLSSLRLFTRVVFVCRCKAYCQPRLLRDGSSDGHSSLPSLSPSKRGHSGETKNKKRVCLFLMAYFRCSVCQATLVRELIPATRTIPTFCAIISFLTLCKIICTRGRLPIKCVLL